MAAILIYLLFIFVILPTIVVVALIRALYRRWPLVGIAAGSLSLSAALWLLLTLFTPAFIQLFAPYSAYLIWG